MFDLMADDKEIITNILRKSKGDSVRDARTVIVLSQLLDKTPREILDVVDEANETVQEIFRNLK